MNGIHRTAAEGYATTADSYVEDVIVNRVRSTSFIAALPPDERAKVDEEVRALIDGEPLLTGKAVVTLPYETAAFVTTRSD